MRSRVIVVLALLGGSVAWAEDARPRSIWLECKAPAVWPVRPGTPVRLSCRVDGAVSGPAFWQTVNPFVPDRSSDLLDPFDAVPHYLDLLHTTRRPRPVPAARPRLPVESLVDPFEAIPSENTDTINPFQPEREESSLPAPPR
jgi:hypothetical protein